MRDEEAAKANARIYVKEYMRKKEEKERKKQEEWVSKRRIPEGMYLWLCSLWDDTNPEKSEISEYEYKAIKSLWWHQDPYKGAKPVLSNKQMKLFNDIYERYQKRDVRS